MKIVYSPLKMCYIFVIDLFKSKEKKERERKANIKKVILEIHSRITEGITRYVIMGKSDSFECKKFIELYKSLSEIQNEFLKTGKIKTSEFIIFIREVNEYYDRCFEEIA